MIKYVRYSQFENEVKARKNESACQSKRKWLHNIFE